MKTRIATDAATIAVFDLEALRHRIDCDGDWWTSSIFPELSEELASHNLYLIDTGMDGLFNIEIETEDVGMTTELNVPSGKLFIVCGEEIPAEGLTPELTRGGLELSMDAISVLVSHRISGNIVSVGIRPKAG